MPMHTLTTSAGLNAARLSPDDEFDLADDRPVDETDDVTRAVEQNELDDEDDDDFDDDDEV